MKSTYRNYTLEELENEYWNEPGVNDTGLVKRVHAIRKKQLDQLSIEDLRTMISQQFNLDYLIPIAIEKLQENILAEGDLYAGDLLEAVLKSSPTFWSKHKSHWKTLTEVYSRQRSVLESDDEFRQLKKSFEIFERIHS